MANKGSLGKQILVEYYNCSVEVLNDATLLENNMVEAAKEAGSTVINSNFHHFSPFGASGVVVIQESHLAIHTWPEYGYAAVDIFTCGEMVDPWVSYQILKKAFEAEHGSALEMNRGQLGLLKKEDVDLHTMRSENTESSQASSPKFTRNIWFTERDENTAISLRHTGDLLYSAKSDYQKVEVYETFAYGRMLVVDGVIMTTEKDEHAYHEMISHVPINTHKAPKRVLVIGGGDGGTVREVLKHEEVEEVVMVEIDEKVVEASKQFLPSLSRALDHEKLRLIIGDGISYVHQSPSDTFDLVLVDSTDPIGPGEGLFTKEFYKDVHRILRKDGIMVSQSESPRFNVPVFCEIFQVLKSIYGEHQVHAFLFNVPTYPSGLWSFSYCSKGEPHPTNTFDEQKAVELTKRHRLEYYNPDVHRAAFALPTFAQRLLDGQQ